MNEIFKTMLKKNNEEKNREIYSWSDSTEINVPYGSNTLQYVHFDKLDSGWGVFLFNVDYTIALFCKNAL